MKPQTVLLPADPKGDADLVIQELEKMVFTQGDNSVKFMKEERYVFTKKELLVLLRNLASKTSGYNYDIQKRLDDFLKEQELL